MASQRALEGEDQEALFSSYPCAALYYVQSPSTASHANSISDGRNPSSDSTLLSPFPPHEDNRSREASRFTLSRYSSSRGSNNSFLHEKKITYDLQSRDSILKSGRLTIVDGVGEDGGEGLVMGKRKGFWRFIALDPSSSCCWFTFQLLWRFVASVAVALLVFFLATKPPSPKVSFKIVGFKQFNLGEGLDNTGVITKILSCNCSIQMVIDNNSKAFGLHIHPPTLEMAFGRLKLASSQGPESYVRSDSSLILRLYIGANNKPVYGAGQSMEDMLKSGQGLPVMVRVKSKSSYRVVWNLIRLSYHHHKECILMLNGAYDKKLYVQIHNATCTTSA